MAQPKITKQWLTEFMMEYFPDHAHKIDGIWEKIEEDRAKNREEAGKILATFREE